MVGVHLGWGFWDSKAMGLGSTISQLSCSADAGISHASGMPKQGKEEKTYTLQGRTEDLRLPRQTGES
jgi:hypothetical protein